MTLAKYRETFCVSGAKDDPSDAQLALELLVTHPERLSRLNPESASMRVLQQLVEQRRCVVDDVRRITNRITDALKQYFPQVLGCSSGSRTRTRSCSTTFSPAGRLSSRPSARARRV
jgi:hypothetical protein